MRPVTVALSPRMLAMCRDNGSKAEIGGASHVRGGDRASALAEDQLVGQVANLAYLVHHFGTARGVHEYQTLRHIANLHPTRGDGGQDVLGLDLDVKGSKLRTNLKLEEHHLLVRPSERHPGWTYVCALVESDFSAVHLMGWATDWELPEPSEDPRFRGAHAIRCKALHPLPPLRWSLAA